MSDIIETAINERLANYEESGVGYYYKPLADAADEFIKFAENPELRIHTGIPTFDSRMRGVAPGELCVITGYAHSGKTVLLTEIMLANKDEPIVLFTPDETRSALLTKLAVMETGVSAIELERRIQAQDEAAKKLLIETAEKFHMLAVFDESVNLYQMHSMVSEVEQAFGVRPKAFMFDYAALLNEQTDVRTKLEELKRFGKSEGLAGFVLNQTSRSAGAGGKALGIDSGEYGGEQQATFMITVRRKIAFYQDKLRELEEKIANATNLKYIQMWEEQRRDILVHHIPEHHNTVSLALVKNKRPPMTKTGEVDFRIDELTGRITEIDSEYIEEEYIEPNIPGISATELLKGSKT